MTVATLPASGPRHAAAVVQGSSVQVPCPSFCTADHDAGGPRPLADVAHSSDSEWVTAPVGVGGQQTVLEAFISQYPFSDDPAPVLALDATGSGEFAGMTAAQALAFADQLVAHADCIRRLAMQMAD